MRLISAAALIAAVLTLASLSYGATPAITPLGFDQAIEQIVRRSTAVATQAANVGGTRARDLPIRLAFTPSLSASASTSKYRYGGVTDGGSVDTGTRSAQLNAQMNLFHFGADYSNWKAADADEDAQAAQLEATVLRAEETGVGVLVAEIQNALEVEISRKQVEARSRLAAIGHERYKRGLLPLQEASKLDIDLANSEAHYQDSLISEAAAAANLKSALGEGTVEPRWPWLDRFGRPGAWRSARFDVEALPSWRSAHRQLEAEEERVTRNLQYLLPSLDSQASYGWTNAYTNNGPLQAGWTGTLSVTLPLIDHLSTYATYRSQVYTRQAAELTLEQLVRDTTAEYETSAATFEHAYGSALARDATLTTSRRLYGDNLRRMQAGRISANDLNLDEQRLYESELLAVQGWAAAHLAFSRVCHARGHRLSECR